MNSAVPDVSVKMEQPVTKGMDDASANLDFLETMYDISHKISIFFISTHFYKIVCLFSAKDFARIIRMDRIATYDVIVEILAVTTLLGNVTVL